MGTIFEELIRRFNEENNEEAGEHFTPRDVVKLMANLIFLPIADQIESGTYLVYDGACGTGGMLTVAEETLHRAGQRARQGSVHPPVRPGESTPKPTPSARPTCCSRAKAKRPRTSSYGSTLSHDAFPSPRVRLHALQPALRQELEDRPGADGRQGATSTTRASSSSTTATRNSRLITRSSDGQLMFLVNKLTKMKHDTPLGSRIAEVHNGSSLFTGDAGQGESNIRRWIIENDWLEAIIALPLNMFYNTGIATYIWVLTNRKPEHRKGKVQLIDATEMFQPLRKNLGKKNCELSDEQIRQISEMFLAFEETEQSKIFPNEAFGYWKITVERPLRLATHVTPEKLAAFKKTADKKLHKPAELLAGIAGGRRRTWTSTSSSSGSRRRSRSWTSSSAARSSRPSTPRSPSKDEAAEPVIKKKTKEGVEYEPDPDLRDTEQVPLLEEGGIEAFFRREVLPHVPDAWIDHVKTQIGYEISFTRHFYKPKPLRSLDEIKTDLEALQAEAEGLLDQIVAEGSRMTTDLRPYPEYKDSGLAWLGRDSGALGREAGEVLLPRSG